MTTLIIGASAGVGRALGRALALTGHSLLLVARDLEDLQAEAQHLRLTYGANVDVLSIDGANIDLLVKALAPYSNANLITNILFPIGISSDRDDGSLDWRETQRLVSVNLTAVISTCQRCLPALVEQNTGNLVGFGSIAAVRGRGENMVYSAAKRGLESYFESLRHRTVGTGIRVQFYRLGYIDTQQSFGKSLLFPKIHPDAVASVVVRNLGRDIGFRHLPRFWFLVATLLRSMPWALFKRLNF